MISVRETGSGLRSKKCSSTLPLLIYPILLLLLLYRPLISRQSLQAVRMAPIRLVMWCSLTQPAFFSYRVTERNKEMKEKEATKDWQNLEAQCQYFIAVGNVFRLSRRYLGCDLNSALCVVVQRKVRAVTVCSADVCLE